MKKYIAFALVLAMIFGLAACKAAPDAEETTATTEATIAPTTMTTVATEAPTDTTDATGTDVTEAPTTAPTTAPTAAPTQAPTEETHSVFYAPGYSVDQIITYFNEVALGMESASSDGNAALVQKWEQPVRYRIEGMPNRKDAQTLNELAKQLNAVEGFPGIHAATGLDQNLTLYFLKDVDYKTQFGHVLEDVKTPSVLQLWHNDSNGAYTGRIGFRQEATQEERDAAIPEKLMNLLGISRVRMQTVIPEDSKEDLIITLSDLDWAVIRLLYNPRIHNGMNADECEMIIRELYY